MFTMGNGLVTIPRNTAHEPFAEQGDDPEKKDRGDCFDEPQAIPNLFHLEISHLPSLN
jgi:hypothetical protein